MTGATITLNNDEIWTLINAHLEAAKRHTQIGKYANSSDEKARADYLRTLVTKSKD